jgi:hypothetical protein
MQMRRYKKGRLIENVTKIKKLMTILINRRWLYNIVMSIQPPQERPVSHDPINPICKWAIIAAITAIAIPIILLLGLLATMGICMPLSNGALLPVFISVVSTAGFGAYKLIRYIEQQI